MGVVAVYALNDEFKSILRESKNGMVSPMSYVLAKSTMVIEAAGKTTSLSSLSNGSAKLVEIIFDVPVTTATILFQNYNGSNTLRIIRCCGCEAGSHRPLPPPPLV